jgi:hypothetical protein
MSGAATAISLAYVCLSWLEERRERQVAAQSSSAAISSGDQT